MKGGGGKGEHLALREFEPAISSLPSYLYLLSDIRARKL